MNSNENMNSGELPKIIAFLNGISYFDDWDIEKKKECARFSKTKKYTKEQIIFESGNLSTHQYVHFIISGKAKTIQMIQAKTYVHKYLKKNKNNDCKFQKRSK